MNNLLTPDQICQLLRVKKSTLYSWTSSGLIPYIKINGLVRFKEDEIQEWLKLKERGVSISKVERMLRGLED